MSCTVKLKTVLALPFRSHTNYEQQYLCSQENGITQHGVHNILHFLVLKDKQRKQIVGTFDRTNRMKNKFYLAA